MFGDHIVDNLIQEIKKLKKELDAVILVHNYQLPSIQDVADYIGDSLELSIKVAVEVNAKYIVFCGVDFMAEQVAVINRNAIVLHPDPSAQCPMANMITLEDVRRARKQYPNTPIVMYVNSPAIVKAESDYIVTSANAVNVVKAIDSDVIIFGPDRHLAEYVAEVTGKTVIPIPPNGHCPVHVKFNPFEITNLKTLYRDSIFIAHPECTADVKKQADFIGSTSQMIKFVRNCQCKHVLVGTEIGLIYRLARENPDKVFIPASTSAICLDMKKITIEKVYRSLKDKVYRVEVPEEIARRVVKAIENTYRVLGVEPPWSKK